MMTQPNTHILDDTTCDHCDDGPRRPPHTCPYRADIYDDTETLCTCCEDCEHQCAQDI